MGQHQEGRLRRLSLAWQLPVLAIAIVSAAVFAVRKNDTAYAEPEPQIERPVALNTNPNNRELLGSFKETFGGSYDPKHWYISDFTIYNSHFRNSWSPDNVDFPKHGGYTLKLSRARSGDLPFVGGEVMKIGWAQYGRVEAIMNGAPGSGAATGVFTHTNDYFNDPHDEIDIEWVGNRPDIVQFNIYTDGEEQGPWKFNVPFDSTKELHLYAFEWEPEEVRWYIDGELIFKVTPEDADIPYTPQRIITHLWTGSIYQWHGQPTFADGATAEVRCLSYQRLEDMASSPRCADEVDRIIHGVEPEAEAEAVAAEDAASDAVDAAK